MARIVFFLAVNVVDEIFEFGPSRANVTHDFEVSLSYISLDLSLRFNCG